MIQKAAEKLKNFLYSLVILLAKPLDL